MSKKYLSCVLSLVNGTFSKFRLRNLVNINGNYYQKIEIVIKSVKNLI